MKKRKQIQIPPAGTRIPYLKIWCNRCKTEVKSCRENENSPLGSCAHGEKLRYRIVCFVPGQLPRKRVVRILDTTSFTEAIKQVAILKQQIDAGITEAIPETPALQPAAAAPVKIAPNAKPELFTHVFGRYLASLKGEGVAPHLRVVRSKGHISDSKNCGKQFCLALKNAGYDLSTFRLTDISDDVIGAFHEHIISKGYGNTSYNRFFSMLTTFASWAEREGYPSVKRFFEKTPRRTVTPRPEIISAEEFQKTISAISYENGWQEGIGKNKKRRNNFRDFLIPSFRYAAITGRRLEEILSSKFSDVHTDENGKPLVISFVDFKVSRIVRTAPGEERKVYTPITKEIADFLSEQGFGKRPADDFILAPEIRHNRIPFMRSALSRGFTHFYKVAYPDSTKEISFKTLRKTYLTNLAIHMGKDVTAVSGHSGTAILKHYLNEKQISIAESLHDFSVFGKSEELKKQLTKAPPKQQFPER